MIHIQGLILNQRHQFKKKLKKKEEWKQSSVQPPMTKKCDIDIVEQESSVQQEIKEKQDVEPELSVQQEIKEKQDVEPELSVQQEITEK